MSFEFVRKLPVPSEIKEQYPVPEAAAKIKIERDKEIKDVFTGNSDKFLVIIGPCSADNEEAVLDYTMRLAKVQEKVKSSIENMTGLEVADVNIHIASVDMENEKGK